MAVLADIIGTLRSAFQLGPKASRLTLSWAGLSAPRTVTFADVAGEITTFTTNTTSPNATVPVKALQIVDGATNVDVAILPKGTGAFMLQIPDGTTAGGNKRGARAADLQTSRASADQVASGLGSFVAGNNNLASANYTVALGGGNIASNAGAFVAGSGNTSSGIASFAVGLANLASGKGASAFGGSNTVSGTYASAFGVLGTASGNASVAFGAYSTTNGIIGQIAEGFWNLVGLGIFQTTRTGVRQQTTNATPTDLTIDAATAAVANQLTLRPNSVFRVRGVVLAINRDTLDAKEWVIEALIVRGGSAASTAFIGTPTVTSTFASAGASAWSLAVAADTTNGAFKVTGTGAASTTIRWMGALSAVEVMGLPPEVTVIMDYEGANGSSTFTDTGSLASTWTRSGANVTISTANILNGTSSLQVNGSGDYLEASGVLLPPTSDWELSFDFRLAGAAGRYIMSAVDATSTAAGSQFGVYMSQAAGSGNTTNNISLFLSNGTTYTSVLTTASPVTQLTNHTMLLKRSSNVISMSIDGGTAVTAAFTGSIPQPVGRKFRIGDSENTGSDGPTTLTIDRLRLTRYGTT